MTITGTIDTIRCQKPDSGWAAATLATPRGKVVITGIMPPLHVGMTCEVTGEPFTNRYGEQLKVSSFLETRPSDAEGIYKYLSSGLIDNIGPVYARKIVDAFGDDTLNVLDFNPERVKEVKGIGPKRAEAIIKSIENQRDIRTIMIWLKRYDLSNGLAAKIYQAYGNKSIAVLESNPYVLADDIHGVAFKTADQVARKLGMRDDSPFRIRSGINAYLEDRASQGHTCSPVDKAECKIAGPDYLNLSLEKVEEILLDPKKDRRRFIIDADRLFLPLYYHAERKIAARLLLLNGKDTGLNTPDMASIGRKTGMKYSPEQESAILTAAWESVMILTGGPGTGKTATTNAIITMLEDRKKKVVLAAPTGRAAKRMSEVTGRTATTIHRMLGFSGGDFLHCEDDPIVADAVIVDECSMIDTLLMNSLLKAIKPGTKLILVGDVDQLPSVGAGSVLRDIIDSDRITTVRLTQVFRQAQDSDIIMNAHRINRGGMPVIKPEDEAGDFVFIKEEDKDKAADTIVRTVKKLVSSGTDPRDIQVLSPMRREWDSIGATALNRALQALLNPDGKVATRKEGTEFRVGDRIMQVKNNYDKELFNGDIGYITRALTGLNDDKALFEADFDGYVQRFTASDAADVELAYASTVHKSQGSEYPVVVMPVHNAHFIMLKRNLLYTGITRAKTLCCLVGTLEAVQNAVRREDTDRRDTMLLARLLSPPEDEGYFPELLF
jgi:helicase, putative, RecD/TraA family